ncbi:MAG: hypothetical protein ABR953_02055 [Candidatus Acidiferrales bacterium]|jgi:hypothetical protein
MTMAVAVPDLSARPFRLSVERAMTAAPGVLYRAWPVVFAQLDERMAVGF